MNARRKGRIAIREDMPGAGDRRLEWPGDPESLTAEAVDFEAVAHVLANTCRRGGRLRRYHSLAAHAVLVSEVIETLGASEKGDGRRVALHALVADAGAAWLGPDASAASHRGADRLKRLRTAVDRAVREAAGLRGGLSPEEAELLRFVGRMAEAAEDRDIPGARDAAAPAVAFPALDLRIRPVEPGRAARLWMERLRDLREPRHEEESPAASLAGKAGEEAGS